MSDLLSKVVYGPAVRRAVRKVLVGRNRLRLCSEEGRFTRPDVDRILEETWRIFAGSLSATPRCKDLGSSRNLRIAVFSLALYRALLAGGRERDYATELTTDVLWVLYEKSALWYRSISRIFARDPQKQMNLILRMSLRYPFSRPGYDWKVHPAQDTFAVDFYRCPVHDYFRAQGEEELEFFRNSWCTLDFALAEALVRNGKYERPRTLSAGDPMCEMRWTGVRTGSSL